MEESGGGGGGMCFISARCVGFTDKLEAGCLLLAAGWLLATCCRLLADACLLLVAGGWLLACWLLAGRRHFQWPSGRPSAVLLAVSTAVSTAAHFCVLPLESVGIMLSDIQVAFSVKKGPSGWICLFAAWTCQFGVLDCEVGVWNCQLGL